MDIEYLADKVKDELMGSKSYIKMAIELKPMTESWSKKFYDMSIEEHKHANNFYTMFNEYCSKVAGSVTDMPEYIKDLRSETIDFYTEYTNCIKSMWEIYKG